ncbi:MAG TPA: hypothetical protein VLF91_01240 [Candidatus Saccharimonadales bacterium]|nr:hypothetical protein [Candidatus Saccharimonadales bacterium]
MFRQKSQSTQTLTPKKKPNKLIIGFAAFAGTAVIATTGLAAAASPQTPPKPTKEQCAAAGFTNYGQCVKEWAHNKNHPGNGYGGNNVSVTTNLNLTMDHSSNNVVKVVTNIVLKFIN